MNAHIPFVLAMSLAFNMAAQSSKPIESIITDGLPCDSLQADAGKITLNCNTITIDDIIVGTTNLPDSLALFQWTLNGVVVSITPSVHIQALGTYIFTVTDTLNGCSASDTLDFTQDFNLPIADAGPDMSIETCYIPTATLDGSGSSTGSQFEYFWTGPGILIPDAINPIVNEPGVYTLTVINDENGCSATDMVWVDYLIVEIGYAFETTPDSCHTNSGTASVVTNGFNPPILWSTGETTSTITGLAAGTYGVTVTIGLCVDDAFVIVDSLGCTSTAEAFADTKFHVQPNPNNGQFSVLLNVATPTSLEMELVDVLGRTLSTLQPMKSFGEGQHRIDFQQTGLPNGSYYLMVKNDTGRMGVKVEVVR